MMKNLFNTQPELKYIGIKTRAEWFGDDECVIDEISKGIRCCMTKDFFYLKLVLYNPSLTKENVVKLFDKLLKDLVQVLCDSDIKCWVFECLSSFLSNTADDQEKELLEKKYDEFKHGLKVFEDCCYVLVDDQIDYDKEIGYIAKMDKLILSNKRMGLEYRYRLMSVDTVFMDDVV